MIPSASIPSCSVCSGRRPFARQSAKWPISAANWSTGSNVRVGRLPVAQGDGQRGPVAVQRAALADRREALRHGRRVVGPARGHLAHHPVVEADEHLRRVLALHEREPVRREHRGDLGGRAAGQVQQQVGRVVAGVDQLAPAARRRVRAPAHVRGVEGVEEAVGRADLVDAADRAGREHRLRLGDGGEEELVVGAHERDPRRGDGVAHLGRLRRGQAQGLLAQDVPPGGGRGDHGVAVQVMRQADVDRVDVGLGDQRAEVVVRAWRRAAARGARRSPGRRPR